VARRHSIADARNSLPKLVRDAETGRTVELTRRGKPVAVLIGRRDYDRLSAGPRRFSEAYAAFLQGTDLKKLGLDPDELFGSLRDLAAGRDVSL
jgi:prevent-host-death family protein